MTKLLITLYRKTRDGLDLLQDDHLIECFMKMGRTFKLLTCAWHIYARSEHCTCQKRKLAPLVQLLKKAIYSKTRQLKTFQLPRRNWRKYSSEIVILQCASQINQEYSLILYCEVKSKCKCNLFTHGAPKSSQELVSEEMSVHSWIELEFGNVGFF